jgi:hypothetical protein
MTNTRQSFFENDCCARVLCARCTHRVRVMRDEILERMQRVSRRRFRVLRGVRCASLRARCARA